MSNSDLFINTNQGLFKRLQLDPDAHAAGAYHVSITDSVFSKSRYIQSESGQWTVLGDWDYNYSFNRLDQDKLLQGKSTHFEWAPERAFGGRLSGLDFDSNRTRHDDLVKVVLSFENADLARVNKENLKVAAYNQRTGEWEVQETEVNWGMQTVMTFLFPYVRYAVVHGLNGNGMQASM